MKRAARALIVLILAAPAFCLSPALAAAPSTASAQARGHWRAGESLPAEVLRAGPNVNYAAQRLRRPPEGYGWFTLDGEFLLASLTSGLILEVAQ